MDRSGFPTIHPPSSAVEAPSPFAPRIDRLVNAKELKHRVVFSQQHIYRLEDRGEFPKRVHLGKARIGWREIEIIAWMQAKIDARTGSCTEANAVLGPNDRFVSKKELRSLVLYSPQRVRVLELEGEFPRRIWIGRNRVAWLEREILEWRASRMSNSVK